MSTGMAQAERPRTNTCENGSAGSCFDDAIYQQAGLINGMDDMIQNMAAVGIFSLVRSQTEVDIQPELTERISTLRRANARAQSANDATSDDEYDEMLAQGDKEKKNSCKNSDLSYYNSLEDEGYLPPGFSWVDNGKGNDKFGNGKCDVFHATDLDGNSVVVNELAANMCVAICKDKLGHDGTSQKGKSKARFTEEMLDSIAAGRTANQMLRMQSTKLNEFGALFSELQLSGGNFPIATTADVCASSGTGEGTENGYLAAEAVLQDIITGFDSSFIVGTFALDVLEGGNAIAHDICGQDGAGYNANVTCIVMSTLTSVGKGISNVLQGSVTVLGDAKEIVAINGEIAEMNRADDAKACSKLIHDEFTTTSTAKGKIILMQEDITLLKSELSVMKSAAGDTDMAIQKLDQKLQQIMVLIEKNNQLLLTPLGLRK